MPQRLPELRGALDSRPRVSQWTCSRPQGPRAAGRAPAPVPSAVSRPPPGVLPEPRVAPSLGEEAVMSLQALLPSGMVAQTGSASSRVWLAPLAVSLRPRRVPSGAETP